MGPSPGGGSSPRGLPVLRGLRPRHPLRLAREPGGTLVVETGAGTFTAATAGALVLSALARHDGHLDTGTLVRELAGPEGAGTPLEEVARGIADLVQDGVLVRTRSAPAERRVRVVAVGDVDPRPCRTALAAGGLHEVVDDADLVVVLCRDHGDPELDTELRGLDDAGTPALLVRVGTARCWIGPLLSGDRRRPAGAPPVGGPVTGGRSVAGGTVHTATCVRCLLEALRRNAPGVAPGTGPGAVVPARSGVVLAGAAAGLVAAAVDALVDLLASDSSSSDGASSSEGAGAEGSDRDDEPDRWSEVREIDLRTLTTTAHPVPRCRHARTGPAAVEPDAVEPDAVATDAVATDAVETDAVRDGAAPAADRAVEFLRRTASLVSPVTGVLSPVRVRPVGGGYVLATTTHPVRWRTRPGAPARWVRATASAVGRREDEARAAATGEALERGSASWHGDETVVRARAAELLAVPGARVLLPQDLGHHSAAQVAAGEGPPPLPSDVVTDFSPLRRLTPSAERGPVWIASGAAYFGHRDDAVSVFTRPDSNGCAVGATSAEATLSGLLELVERDAVALWWWPRADRPGLDADVLGEARPALEGELRRRGRTLALLDVTTDLRVPVVVAVGARRDGTGPVFGFGAHLDHVGAAHRAVRELLQVVALLADGGAAGDAGWDGVRLDDVGFVRPHGWTPVPAGRPAAPGGPVPVGGDLDEVLRRVGRAGVEVFALDLTRPGTGVPAVRVVAPALRPWYRRLGPGRLVLPDGPNPWSLPV